MNTRKPKVGELVLFTPNPDDSVAKSNYNDQPIPAIVTRVWSEVCVNLKIVPDCGPMQDRTSVSHVTANPAGYHFEFMDILLKRQAVLAEHGIPRRNRMDLLTPAEKAIKEAVREVEKAGTDVLLTDAVNLLHQAADKVADYVETNQ